MSYFFKTTRRVLTVRIFFFQPTEDEQKLYGEEEHEQAGESDGCPETLDRLAELLAHHKASVLVDLNKRVALEDGRGQIGLKE